MVLDVDSAFCLTAFITLFLAISRGSSFSKGERGDTEQISLTTLPSGITRVAYTIAVLAVFIVGKSEVHGQQLTFGNMKHMNPFSCKNGC